jgi:hypothetical protein
LEKLPAVQAAAEDEMAFEQRAAVAENLQELRLVSSAEMLSPKSKVQSPIFTASAPTAGFQKAFNLRLASLRLIFRACRSGSSSSSPSCCCRFAPARPGLVAGFARRGGADTVWVPLLAGAACWVVIFLLLPKPMWIYVFGHELTHALWTWLFGGQVKKMKVTSPAATSSFPKPIFSSRSRRIFSRFTPRWWSACLRWAI